MRSMGRSIVSLFVLLALYLSVLINVKNYTTVFIAFLTFGWHAFANWHCGMISSYRFKNPDAKYVEIKNKVIRKIFLHKFSMYGVNSKSENDNRTNIIGLVLNIINILLFISFEILLFMPKIPCDAYVLRVGVPKHRRGFYHLYFNLDSYNEIIPANASRIFVIAVALIFFIFLVLFERQINEHRRKIKRETKPALPQRPLKNIKWHYPLYIALTDIAVRRNNKKHKFWYYTAQLKQIEALVIAASKYAEVKTKENNGKLVSFTVFDTLNERVTFEGFFIK